MKHPAINLTPYFETHLKHKGISKNDFFAWGLKPLSRVISAIAKAYNKEVIYCEDGFVSYILTDNKMSDRFSVLLDTKTPYYDARRPSDLEALIINTDLTKDKLRTISRYLESGVTKYNFPKNGLKNKTVKNKIILIEQVSGDMSMKYGLSPKSMSLDMIKYATEVLSPKFDMEVVVKKHPDTIFKGKKGIFDKKDIEGIDILPHDTNLQIYGNNNIFITATSQLGFEALIRGEKVICFGFPFYAGWGLTHDFYLNDNIAKRRNQSIGAVTASHLAVAALIDYPSYVHPYTGESANLDQIIDYIEKNECTNATGAF